ncbi:tryptophan synthase subunit alpha [Jeotgalibaca caeni]|uniref:tryptophan synthase subunit alpha n=1 Tax=Jeotgalibaca caeni TaxID=3028623 RepID=UPI00237E0BFD|nr:tryptophan synthase subunit alpha [Jeotgalibaca caeni]MDE1548135.1 tryptophan synthase subunit alpha [Jeotgalibaca caeni]
MNNVVFYLPVNYPDKTTFFQLLEALDEAGVGFVEFGIPTTDAYMDGPLIKDALATVMAEGFTHEDLILILRTIKSRFSFSIILMTYESGRRNMRLDSLASELYDGILCVDAPVSDLPPKPVLLYPPGITEKELKSKLLVNKGFAYVISGEGKTGTFTSLPTAYKATIQQIKRYSDIPTFVGFGLKGPNDVEAVVAGGADGGVIGTEFLRRYQEDGLPGVKSYLGTFQ